MTFWSELVDHLDTGEAAFVACVADHTRHSPGTRGAKMLVRPDASQFGTIGGGIMEADILERAAAALAIPIRDAETETLHHRENADGERSGLICAGKQTMVYFVALPTDRDRYAAFRDAVVREEEKVLAIEHGKPSVRHEAVGDAAPIRLDGEAYLEHAVNHRRVAIAGGGHCGLALSRTMKQLGYHVTVFETRADVFTLESNEWADRTIVLSDYAELGEHIGFPALTHIVVMTSDFPSDVRALLGAAELRSPFKGLMGSSAKLKRIAAELEMAGHPQLFETLYAPIGLPMTSNTPEEIAISIAAQILQLRDKLFRWERPSPA